MFLQLCVVHQSHPGPIGSAHSDHTNGLMQCILHGAIFEQYPEATTGSKYSSSSNYQHCLICTCYTFAHELHWLLVCFQVQFRALIISYQCQWTWVFAGLPLPCSVYSSNRMGKMMLKEFLNFVAVSAMFHLFISGLSVCFYLLLQTASVFRIKE